MVIYICEMPSNFFTHLLSKILRSMLLSINLENIIWKGNRLVEVEDDTKTMTCSLSSIP